MTLRPCSTTLWRLTVQNNLTMPELHEILLESYDIELLIELLQINATELLERFQDKIELFEDKILEALDDD